MNNTIEIINLITPTMEDMKKKELVNVLAGLIKKYDIKKERNEIE